MSSTYEDLQEERREVMQALLELNCIPAGMELFPAANEDQWTLIKGVIDDCDYYLVVISGRYGSTNSDGMSYTEMEYRYALQQKKPIIAFLHKDPKKLAVERYEPSQDGQQKLENFRKFVQKKMVKYWTTPAELGGVVSRSVVNLIKTSPAVGWLRADQLPETTSAEMLRLRHRIEELEATLAAVTTNAPAGTENLAQGSDEIIIFYTYVVGDLMNVSTYRSEFISTWDAIYYQVSPSLIDEATEEIMKRQLNKYIADMEYHRLTKTPRFKGQPIDRFAMSDSTFQTIKVQLRALGLITKSIKTRSVKDSATYWTLTPYGDSVMTKLRAIRRDDDGDLARDTDEEPPAATEPAADEKPAAQ